MHFLKTVQFCTVCFKSFFMLNFSYNYLFFVGCFGLSISEDTILQNVLTDKRIPDVPRLQKRTASRPLENRSVFSVLHEPSNMIIESEKLDSDIDVYYERTSRKHRTRKQYSHHSVINPNINSGERHVTRKFCNDSKRKTHVKNSGLRLRDSLRKNRQSKNRGRKKNLENNQEGLIVGMRNYDVNAINTNAITENQLCPEWPRYSQTVVNCSKGRQIGSLCTVDCILGFKLREGSPTKRQCESSVRKRPILSKRRKPSWSGKDDQFVCGRCFFFVLSKQLRYVYSLP